MLIINVSSMTFPFPAISDICIMYVMYLRGMEGMSWERDISRVPLKARDAVYCKYRHDTDNTGGCKSVFPSGRFGGQG